MSDEGVDEGSRHGFVVLASVADVGENLGQRLLFIDLDEMLVLGQMFLLVIISVDILAHIVVVALLVHETLHGQTVGELGLFCRPANGECGDGHRELRKVQRIDDLLRLVDGGA